MLDELVSWWSQQMRDLLLFWPANRPTHVPDALLVTAEGDGSGIAAILRTRQREWLLGHFSVDTAGLRRLAAAQRAQRSRHPVVLRLPWSSLLERDLVLPLAVERDLGQVLAYDMDKWTPFAAQELAWSWRITQRDHQQGRLHARLALAQKRLWEPLVTALGQAGIPVTALEFVQPDGGWRRIPLAHASAEAAGRRRAGVVAGALCGVLAVAAVVLPFVQQSLARSGVEAQIAALQGPAARAQALRQRVAGSAAASDVAAAERARSGDALAILAALTDILPDDTFLTDFSLQSRQLALAGQSSAAARLIPALSSTPMIRNAFFAAPVTRSQAGGADSFSIRAEVAP